MGRRGGLDVRVLYDEKISHPDYLRMIREASERGTDRRTDVNVRRWDHLPGETRVRGRVVVGIEYLGECPGQGEGPQGRADRTQRVRWMP